MDELVKLARRHGSGNATLTALNASGIRTVRDVAALDPEELASVSGLKPSSARKMSLEARRMVGEISSGSTREEEKAVLAPEIPAGRKPATSVRGFQPRELPEVEARVYRPGTRKVKGTKYASPDLPPPSFWRFG